MRYFLLLFFLAQTALAGSVINTYVTHPAAAGGGGIVREDWAATDTAGGQATSVVVTMPTHATDDLLLAIGLSDDTGSTWNTETGWTQPADENDATAQCNIAVMWKIATSASETLTWTSSNNRERVVYMFTFSGHNASTPVEVGTFESEALSGADDTFTKSSETPTDDLSYAIAYFCGDGGDLGVLTLNSGASDADWSMLDARQNGTAGQDHTVAVLVQPDAPSSGGTGAVAVDTDGSPDDGGGFNIVFVRPE